MSLAHPKNRKEWRQHWDVIGFCAQEDAPLRERQAQAAWNREHGPRCGGCAGPATRRVRDTDAEAEAGEELCTVPLCDTCTLADATPPRWVLFSWETPEGAPPTEAGNGRETC